MKKKWIIPIVLLVLFIGVGIFLYFRNTNSGKNSYEAQKIATNQNQENLSNNSTVPTNDSDKNDVKNDANKDNKENSSNNKTENSPPKQSNSAKKESEISEVNLSSFSTKIYTKDSARQKNIQITCNTLNNTTVKPSETFSFCQTVGKATSSKGYEKADIYDHNGNKKQGLGGGNCQVSSTLYNAVLKVSSLVVTERHEHSNHVPYVKKGQDAAVAYGSYDFKFKNNSSNNIKISASTDGNYVYTSLIELKPQ